MPLPTQPQYLTPTYISFDMIQVQLSKTIDIIYDGDTTNGSGMTVEQIEDYMAKGEAFIIQKFLQNYYDIPLVTTLNGDYTTLQDNPQWYQATYVPLRALFLNSAYYQIYLNYFSAGGSQNGKALIENAVSQLNYYANQYFRIDQAGNPLLVNVFPGLKLCANAKQRIAKYARIPCIPSGFDQGFMGIGSIPNFRYGPRN